MSSVYDLSNMNWRESSYAEPKKYQNLIAKPVLLDVSYTKKRRSARLRRKTRAHKPIRKNSKKKGGEYVIG